MAGATRPKVGWADLGGRARAFRVAHGVWSVGQLACLAYLWDYAVTGRHDRYLAATMGFLAVEGGALMVGHGDCPMGPLQRSWGDPVPFFELLLPPRAAKAAVPVLAAASVSAFGAVLARRLVVVVSDRRGTTPLAPAWGDKGP
jgi:hypothetical protein